MRIAIGCDEAAFDLKTQIIAFIKESNHDIIDLGCYSKDPVLYPDFAQQVALAILNQEADRGILLCGTGIGMSITANKIPGIRAAVCHDVYSAGKARTSNDAQILCMGARVIAFEYAKELIKVWLISEFLGGNSTEKVDRINAIEAEYHSC